MSTPKTKAVEPQTELENVVLVSPSGHKYELSVTDSGNLNVKFKLEKKEGDADESGSTK